MITVGNRQCFLDLAMQYAGNAEAAVAMSIQNMEPLTKQYAAGTVLPSPVMISDEVATLYRTEKARPSSINSVDTSEINAGIDFWEIENDFIVQ